MKRIIAVLLLSLLMLQSCTLKERIHNYIYKDDPDTPNITETNGILDYGGYRFVPFSEKENSDYYHPLNYNQNKVFIGETSVALGFLAPMGEPVYVYGGIEAPDATINQTGMYSFLIKESFEFPADPTRLRISAIFSKDDAYLVFDDKDYCLEDILDLSKYEPGEYKRLAIVLIGTKDYNFSILTEGIYELEGQIYLSLPIKKYTYRTYKIKDEFQAEIRKNLGLDS